ncbi:MAG: hypothetical protein GY708_31035, partial [Actinomycetia bacterium]|nr:hypothetical protein [Actinomycetes bacterium]
MASHAVGDLDVWTWHLPYDDSLVDGEVVEITGTDSDGAATTVTFELVLDANAPALTQESDDVQVDEGSTATNTGTYTEANQLVLTASLGTVVDNGDGTWGWSYDNAVDGDLDLGTVTITALDQANNLSTTSFVVSVNNVAPTADLMLSRTTIEEGASTTLLIKDYFDPGQDVVAQTYIDWGDGFWSTADVGSSAVAVP